MYYSQHLLLGDKMTVLCRALLVTVSLMMVVACEQATPVVENTQQYRDIEARLGTVFTAVEDKHFKPPQLYPLSLKLDPLGAALWGATGRDDRGNIYFGLSSYANIGNTAQIYQFNPSTGTLIEQSDVISQLKQANLYKTGMSQIKIHSKIYQANDGYLYFSSFDELGESASRGVLPTYGGHLWRKKPDSLEWEHLLATNEALIAVNTDGRFVYAMGYWGHVLYQFNTLNQRMNRVTVSKHKSHVSRNFIVTSHGDVFVPRISGSNNETIDLVQYNSDLKEVTSHAMNEYLHPSWEFDHGIVSYSSMKNGDVYFATSIGAIYKLAKQANQQYQLTLQQTIADKDNVGAYLPSMFTINGEDFIVGMGYHRIAKQYFWYLYETTTNTVLTYELPEMDKSTLVYGSSTKDNLGNMYMVGVDLSVSDKHKPTIIQLHYPHHTK